MNMIQQAQNKNSISSLDQRLTNLMSTNSGHFGLTLDNQTDNSIFSQNYDSNFQTTSYNAASFDSSQYIDQYYLPQEEISCKNNSRSREPTENLEPADMDLGNSDDEDNLNQKNNNLGEINIKNSIDDKMKSKTIEAMPFMGQDISGLFPMIPPPPPPPIPPPVLKDLFGPPSLDDEFDSFRPLHNSSSIPNLEINLQHGNSIRNLADRPNRHSVSFHQSNNSNHWRNSSDNRQPHRNQNQNFNSPHSNRWKNNSRGSWKRNNYGSHH